MNIIIVVVGLFGVFWLITILRNKIMANKPKRFYDYLE